MTSPIPLGTPRHGFDRLHPGLRAGAFLAAAVVRNVRGATLAAVVLLASLGGMQGAWAAEGRSAAASTVPGAEATSSPIKAVRVTTSMGSFVITLNAERAPLTVQNFLRYVTEGFYTNTLFHRVVGNFVVQGGGYDATTMKTKPTHEYVVNESGNGLLNTRGTVGMARSGPPHSANSQFYINLVDNAELNPIPTRWGYAVFGEVTEGMDVIERMGVVATGSVGPFKSEAPLKPIVIEKIEPLADAQGPAAAPPAPATTPPAETPPAETPPAETPPAEAPPAETSPAETPPSGTAEAETPPAETPPSENAAEETPPAETTPPSSPSSSAGAPGETSGAPAGQGETPPPQ